MEEIRAAIPAEGIEIRALLQLFWSRLGSISHPVQKGKEFGALLKQVGTVDMTTRRIIPRAQSATSGPSPRTAPPMQPSKHFPTLEEIRSVIPTFGIAFDEYRAIFKPRYGRKGKKFGRLAAQVVTSRPGAGRVVFRKPNAMFIPKDWQYTPNPVPPFSSLDEIRAAIPNYGITVTALVTLFITRLTGEGAGQRFADLIQQVAFVPRGTTILIPQDDGYLEVEERESERYRYISRQTIPSEMRRQTHRWRYGQAWQGWGRRGD